MLAARLAGVAARSLFTLRGVGIVGASRLAFGVERLLETALPEAVLGEARLVAARRAVALAGEFAFAARALRPVAEVLARPLAAGFSTGLAAAWTLAAESCPRLASAGLAFVTSVVHRGLIADGF